MQAPKKCNSGRVEISSAEKKTNFVKLRASVTAVLLSGALVFCGTTAFAGELDGGEEPADESAVSSTRDNDSCQGETAVDCGVEDAVGSSLSNEASNDETATDDLFEAEELAIDALAASVSPVEPENIEESKTPAVKNGLSQEGDATFFYVDGKRYEGERLIDGKWYYFDPGMEGAMTVGTFKSIPVKSSEGGGSKEVYYDATGEMAHGERCIRDAASGKDYWYYFDPYTGELSRGFAYIPVKASEGGGYKWTYYDSEGRMLYGEQYINGGWYYLNPYTGAVTYDFVLLDVKASEGGGKKWVYYGPYMGDGRMRYGEQYINGGWYYLTPGTGAVDYEWAYIPAGSGYKWVYYGPYMGDGRMRYGSQKIDDKWYFLDTATGRRLSDQEAANRVVSSARSQIGTSDSVTWRYQQAISDVGGRYCSQGPCQSFVWWCFNNAGMRNFICDGAASGYPSDCYDYFKARGKVDWNPTVGSIAFWQYGGWSSSLSCGHSELVVGSGPGYIKTIGAVTGGVQVRTYSLSNIVGFAHPY